MENINQCKAEGYLEKSVEHELRNIDLNSIHKLEKCFTIALWSHQRDYLVIHENK